MFAKCRSTKMLGEPAFVVESQDGLLLGGGEDLAPHQSWLELQNQALIAGR